MWLVGASATGAWEGLEGSLAAYRSGAWTFIQPRDGLRTFDKSQGQFLIYAGSWRRGDTIAEPSGGTTIDSEGRAAIAAIVAVLQQVGILSSN